MKTIKDIAREMRSVAGNAERIHLYDLRKWGSDSLRAYADLIEEAHKRELADAVAAKCEVCDQVAVAKSAIATLACKDSLHVGNMMAMREALLEIVDCAKDVSERNLSYIEYQARQALSTPPRNCDLYETPKEAGDAFVNETCETPCEVCSVSDRFRNPLIHECGINWLFAEAKGEAK
jgi:hypothetical protein